MMRAPRILILAPHPDDETVACGIAAMRTRAAGSRIFVLYLTTGVPEAGALWPWQRLGHLARVRRRREEAQLAAAALGLAPAGFRDTPSRQLRLDLDRAVPEIAAAIATCSAEALWVPAFEGGHQDHDAANALAASFVGRLPVWEFAAYNFSGARVHSNRFAIERGGEMAIEATAAEAQQKRAALACYASERGNLGYIGVEREACRPLAAHDYGAPPHPGRLFRERFHWVPFRHPRIDFAPSAEVYRDIGSWASAAKSLQTGMLGDRPGGEPGQPEREFARAFDQTEREPGLTGQPGKGSERDQHGLLRPPPGGDCEGGAARGEREAFEQDRLGETG